MSFGCILHVQWKTLKQKEKYDDMSTIEQGKQEYMKQGKIKSYLFTYIDRYHLNSF